MAQALAGVHAPVRAAFCTGGSKSATTRCTVLPRAASRVTSVSLSRRIKRAVPRDVSPRSACFVRRPGGHRQGQDVTVRVQQVTGALAPRPVPQAIE
jgi:hypothetical protein